MLACFEVLARSVGLRIGLSFALLLVVCSAADAKMLYVNWSTGNDTTSYANNSETAPWRTIGRAAWGSTNPDARNAGEAARAGDMVIVAAGTYAAPGTNERNLPVYNPVNSGTPGNPITFTANGIVTLTLSSGVGSVIGSFERDYITWDGFTIHEATAPSKADTGPVTIWLCDGCIVQNLDINGNGDDNGRMDNHTGIRVEASTNILVRNNRIQNVYTAHNVNNGACIQTYSSGNMTFENNELFACGSGIFIKGNFSNNPNNGYITIRYNLIYDIGEVEDGNAIGNAIALHVGAGNTAAEPLRVYQNVVRNAFQSAVKIWMFDGIDPTMNPNHSKVVNNTFTNVKYGVWVTANLMDNAGHVFWNNIVNNASVYAIAYGGSSSNLTESRFDSEHNLYNNFATFAAIGPDDISLATWRTHGQDSAAPASAVSNPLFVNESGGDFRLQSASPARNLGVDFLDLNRNGSTTDIVPAGAYLTGNEIIGRTNGPLPNLPSAPRNLRITTP